MRNKYCLAAMLLAMGLAACTTASRPDLSGMSFASTPQIGKIVWHDLITEDLDGAKRFYQGLFDWTFEMSKGPGGQEYAVARSGNIYVAGMVEIAAATDGSKLSRWLPYVSVADVDETVATGVAAGAKVAVSAREVSIGRVAAVIDPEGAVIGLARSSVGDPDDRTTAPAAGRPVWTELLADNPAAAADFYRALGDYDVSTIERRRGQYTLLSANGNYRAGILKKPADRIKPVWLTYFGVDDPEVAAVLAETLGGKIILPASPELRDGTMAVVTDPAGAILVLQNWAKMEGVE
jgi:predicted enzyme related to lactoylglutathione lyase